MSIVLSMIMVVVMAACVDPDSEPVVLPDSSVLSDYEPIPLLDPFVLTPVAADADPLLLHRPFEVDCPTATWGPEGSGFEIQTGACNYAAFDQPMLTPIMAGDALKIIVWHDTIDFAESAIAHVAVWIGRSVLWEAEVAVPALSSSFEVTVPIEDSPSSNARLGLHLHNHGYNSCRFVAVDLHRHRVGKSSPLCTRSRVRGRERFRRFRTPEGSRLATGELPSLPRTSV